ncbi:hypothetical protein ACLB1G_22510 [Oxalobacteraceae bacterium A2-2]
MTNRIALRRNSNPIWHWLTIAVVVLGGSLFFGLLAQSGSMVLIGLGMAMVLGPVLLLLPELTVWLVLIGAFFFGLLAESAQFAKLTWAVSLLSMMLFIPVAISVGWNRERKLPGFLVVAIVFLLFSILCSALRGYSFQEAAAGFKRYFQSFGVMLAIGALAFSPAAINRWRRLMVFLGLLQFPFALYELLILVPKRGGLASGSDSTDVVAGTFGANLGGGSPNAVMVFFVLLIIAFLVARWRAGLLSGRTLACLGSICALPLFMGETKVAVIMLPLVGASLLRKDFLRNPVRHIPAVLVLVLLTIGLGYVYIALIMHSNLSDVLQATARYNVGDQGYSKGQILNRLTALTFWFQQQTAYDPIGFLMGNGLGSSFMSAGSLGGHLGNKYSQYGIALTAASTLLWDTGVIGLALFVAIFVMAWFAAERLYRATDNPEVRADALAIQASIVLLIMFVVYSAEIVNIMGLQIIYAVVLGYLAYLMNLHGLLGRRGIVRTGAR